MDKNRIEAFSDGFFAILMTIMVLELKVPHGAELSSLVPLIPVFISYVLSFVYLGIYWNNHHHMLQASDSVSGKVLWANTHLMFWLSLVPFCTAWMGENEFAQSTVAVYGFVLLMCAIGYYILAHSLINHHGTDSVLAKAIGGDFKGRASIVIYVFAIGGAFLYPWISFSGYAAVAVWWLVPDLRIEKALSGERG
jgi:uncharacterized membrane protein